jgi:ketosteroid isomerase-like protein
MANQTDPALRMLLDKQEIHEVLMRYCRAIDRCDEELLRSVYHSDAWDDHGPFKGKASDFIPMIVRVLAEQFLCTTHSICNELIEVHGDIAYGETYVIAYHRLMKDGAEHEWIFGGRYVDCFERRQGAWKIAKRVTVNDWETLRPATGKLFAPNAFVKGQRSRDDAVYNRA